MTETQRIRLLQLIEFLEELPAEQFNFRFVACRGINAKCASVACAIGWTPAVFPELVQWKRCANQGELDVHIPSIGWSGYIRVATFLFGIPLSMAADLFAPGQQRAVDMRLPNCGWHSGPRRVAEMLREFLAMVAAGVITVDSAVLPA